MSKGFCSHCGQLQNIPIMDAYLWEIYNRISDGRSSLEPLVFTSEDIQDEEDFESAKLAMERDMINRGLCPECARPDLRRVTEDMILSDEDLKEFQDMWAMEESERRAGC